MTGLGLQIPEHPKACLLYIDPKIFSSVSDRTFLIGTLSIARKCVVKFRVAEHVPTLQDWKTAVNMSLAYKKAICP